MIDSADQPSDELAVVGALIEALGPEKVRTGADIPDRNRSDASHLKPQRPVALVLPRSTADVSVAVRICHAAGQPIVVQGGLTGLAGGARPGADEVAIALERMSAVEEVDAVSGTLTALAGTPLQVIQDAALAAGWTCGIDLGARGSCTIGGNVATNAGGNQVLRYGMTRKQVLGLEAVLPDGRIVTCMNKMLKNNTGYDWTQLFIGSEGTLGIVTRVVLGLHPPLSNVCSALLGVKSTEVALKVLRRLQGELPGGLLVFEGMWREYCQLARDAAGVASPLEGTHEVTLLVEAPMGRGGMEMFETVLFGLIEAGLVDDGIVARSETERAGFWTLRESINAMKPHLPPGISFDVSVPLDRMAAAIEQLRERCAAFPPGTRWLAFGHLADSNIHVRVVSPDMGESLREHIQDVIYGLIADVGGSISAEHGIGRLKRRYLSLTRTEPELELMRAMKAALDPGAILNRGRIFA